MQIVRFVLQLSQLGFQIVGVNGSDSVIGEGGEHGTLPGMVADTTATATTLVGCAALAQSTSIMAGDTECGRG